jgi:alpha-glucosidase
VRDAFDDILRFWFDRCVAGFRIDVAHDFASDAQGNTRRDVVHDVLRRWRRVADSYDPPRVLIGETWVDDLTELMTFYGEGDELHMAFNFPFIFSSLERLPDVVARTEKALPANAWPLWTLSNHDVVRFATRMCNGDERKIRCALLALLTLPGTPVLYQGDELGLEQTHVPPDGVLDVHDRDGCRTPLPWTPEGGWHDPWLPLGSTARNVEDELADANSILSFVRSVIARRRGSDAYESISAPDGVWAYRRGERTIALNLSDESVRFEGCGLPPWDGMILDV